MARPAAKKPAPTTKKSPSSRATAGKDAGRPASIDDYLARVGGEQRALLESLRRVIRRVLPGAEECISYSMPAFRSKGHVVAGFAATARGGSYYPFSGTTLATVAADLEGFSKTKSAVHFTADQPLSAALVRKLVKARLAEIGEQA